MRPPLSEDNPTNSQRENFFVFLSHIVLSSLAFLEFTFIIINLNEFISKENLAFTILLSFQTTGK